MYEDIINKKSLQELYDDALEKAFLDFYTSRALDPFIGALKDDLVVILHLAFLAGYEAAGGHPSASP